MCCQCRDKCRNGLNVYHLLEKIPSSSVSSNENLMCSI